jgi:hypothetical protein
MRRQTNKNGKRIILPNVYIRLMAISVIAMSILIDSVSAKTYYASPKGGGDGSSVESPFAVEDFWDDAQPGDTLILLDGLYTGPRSMVKPPENLSGTKDLPITVRALCDGKVTIDGKCFLRPVALNHNDWWIIEGINACNSKSTVVGLSRSNHCIVRRMCGWNAADGNTNIFAAHYGEHNLFEDCAGWGIARKTFSCSQGGNYTTFRRCFGSWEGCHSVGPKMAFTLFYNSHHITAENCIATWDGKLMRENHTAMGYDGKPFTQWKDGSGKPRHYSNYGVDQPYGCFGMDRIDKGPTKGPFVYGCIAYRLKSQRVVNTPGLFFMRCRQPHDGWFENCAAFVETGAADVRTFNLANVDSRNLTAIGGLKPEFGRGNIFNSIEAADKEGSTVWREMFNRKAPERGAHLYYRYVNGKLTDKPLWPWPMNDRIKELTGVDLTATIFGLAQ